MLSKRMRPEVERVLEVGAQLYPDTEGASNLVFAQASSATSQPMSPDHWLEKRITGVEKALTSRVFNLETEMKATHPRSHRQQLDAVISGAAFVVGGGIAAWAAWHNDYVIAFIGLIMVATSLIHTGGR